MFSAAYFLYLFVVLTTALIKGQLPPSPPSITGDSTFSIGDTGSFTCSSNGGIPDPSVTWYRNGQLVDDTYALTSGQPNTGGTVSNTVSFIVSASDHYVVYECQVDNGVRQDALKLTTLLLVRSTPNPPTLVGPTNPPPGQQNTWTCTSVGSFPPATMTMRRGNQQYTTNEFTTAQQINGETKTWTVTGTLTWTPTVANNGDILYCDVAHEILTTPQTVNLPLVVVGLLTVAISPSIQLVIEGNSQTITCTITGTPAVQAVTWLKNSQTVTIDSSKYSSGGSTNTPTMTIRNFQSSDTAIYNCRAATAAGTTLSPNSILIYGYKYGR